MAIKVRQLCNDLYEIKSETRTSNITTDELNALLDYIGPTTECTFKGRSCNSVVIQRFGQDDYSAWYTDDPTDDTSGCSTRGSLESILHELRNELPPVSLSNSERLETICDFIEAFEDFLDEKGIVIPNDEKDQDPDSASNIYGTDYGNLSDRIEHLLIRYGVLKGE